MRANCGADRTCVSRTWPASPLPRSVAPVTARENRQSSTQPLPKFQRRPPLTSPCGVSPCAGSPGKPATTQPLAGSRVAAVQNMNATLRRHDVATTAARGTAHRTGIRRHRGSASMVTKLSRAARLLAPNQRPRPPLPRQIRSIRPIQADRCGDHHNQPRPNLSAARSAKKSALYY